SRFYHDISPFSRGGEAANLAGLISQIVQIEPELLQSFWDNDLNINPVVVTRFFFDGRRNRKGGFHNRALSFVRNTVSSPSPNSLQGFRSVVPAVYWAPENRPRHRFGGAPGARPSG